MTPKRQKYRAVTARLAAVNRGLVNRRRSSIGDRRRNSTRTNRASTASDTANAPSTTGLVQPRLGPSMMEYTNADNPTIESSAPGGSRRDSSASLEVGTSRAPAVRATRQ